MNTIAKIIGYAYIAAWVLSACGKLDMVVCVGEPGACTSVERPTVKAPIV